MRPIAINQRALRGAKEELDSAREDLRSALGDIDHPRDDFPWRDLMVEGVRSLVDDAEVVATKCHTISSALDDSKFCQIAWTEDDDFDFDALNDLSDDCGDTLLKEIDNNGDGKVDFNEYMSWWSKLPVPREAAVGC